MKNQFTNNVVKIGYCALLIIFTNDFIASFEAFVMGDELTEFSYHTHVGKYNLIYPDMQNFI